MDRVAQQAGEGERLIADVAAGDRASFASLFALYAPKVKAYVRRLGASNAVAEDLVQEVMLRIWRMAGQFDPLRGSASAWIFTIARNAFIDVMRKERHPDELKHDPGPAPIRTPEEDLLARDRMQRARHAMDQLSAAQVRVCDLVLFGDISLRSAADRLGFSLPATKSHLRRGLARLRASVNEAY